MPIPYYYTWYKTHIWLWSHRYWESIWVVYCWILCRNFVSFLSWSWYVSLSLWVSDITDSTGEEGQRNEAWSCRYGLLGAPINSWTSIPERKTVYPSCPYHRLPIWFWSYFHQNTASINSWLVFIYISRFWKMKTILVRNGFWTSNALYMCNNTVIRTANCPLQ